MHVIFCDNYNIRLDAFAFDEYVILVFEKLLLDIIIIKPRDWFLIVVIVCVNWARDLVGLNGTPCKAGDEYPTATDVRKCIDLRAITMFTIAGEFQG